MENKDLHKLLSEIHEEINLTQAVDDDEGKLLRDIEVDINALLKRSGAKNPEEEGISLHRLEEAVSRFEVTHTTLTAQITKLLDILSGSGI
ncbi:MAG: DUF4404 family protein [Anaerolineaceae bacterium]|jgi:hypothetical protein